MQAPLRTLVLTALLSTLGPALACDSHDHTDLSDVVLDGTNDEALGALIDAPVVSDPSRARVFDSPGANAKLGAAPVAFAWRVAGSSEAPGGRQVRTIAGGFGVRGALGLRDAFAHGPAVNGKAYLLVVSSATNPKLLRVFTTGTSFTPSPAAWAVIAAGGGQRTATVTTGIFDDSNLAADGGPFAGHPVSFEVSP